jgi:hypothetical protein
MAYNYGKSEGKSFGEKCRRDHGSFEITAPKGRTPIERPFGLRLSGDRRMDYERIQLRIAARQAGLIVDDEDEGKIKWKPGAKLSQLQTIVIRKAERGDQVWEQHGFGNRITSTGDTPVGFVPALWQNAAMIQARIPRDADADNGDETRWQYPDRIDIVDGLYFNPKFLEIRPTWGCQDFEVPDEGREQFGSGGGQGSLCLGTAGGNLI